MAGHDDGDGVRSVGRAHRARRARLAQLQSKLAVRAGFAVGDAEQRVPDPKLERCAAQTERQLKRAPGPREVLGELPRCLADRRVGIIGLAIHRRRPLEEHLRDALLRGLDVERESRRGVNGGPRHPDTSLRLPAPC